MFDDLAAYYHENVVSSFVEYRDVCNDGVAGRSRDLRAALNAASALFHLREHLPGGLLSRADVERLCPDYALLGDVVNASKHKTLNNKTPHGAPLVTDAGNLGEQLVLIEYEDDAGTYRYIQKTVVVRLSDGSECSLLEILTSVINFWEGQMLSLEVLSKARVFTHDNDIRYRSRADCEANRLTFELVKGLRFHQTMRLLRFNKTTGRAEPIDLTGLDVRSRIYQPKYDIELSLIHDASGKTYKTEITLTEEESLILSRMSSDEERRAYVNNLPSAQAALQQLAVGAGLPKG
ncbi:MAG TPA: hypothetical protein PKD88_11580 [Nitrosomonas sp.]|nr:hypothetical protein [Nitrosomonas sp.]HMW21629.1 hypothetical protein [Nitrosomonas sp.]HMW68185.1 hypothetical protein [Nitrosomonas sp.]HMY62488.1 hypothetical protein [Nitrosomonas sp.]HMY91218.1 hypothetical protein [Nitrosomonas sp.]